MPSKKIVATKKAAARKVAAKAVQPVTASIFRTKVDLANFAVGAKTVKQFVRAVAKLAQTLARMDESGAVKLEQPVTVKGALLATTDAKAAKRFGMEESRSPRGAKTAAAVAKKALGAAPAETAAPAKKAGGKKAAAKKTRVQNAPADAPPVAEAADTAVPAANKRAAKKAAAKTKKAVRKTGAANGSNAPARTAGGEPAAAPEAPPATDTPGAEATAS